MCISNTNRGSSTALHFLMPKHVVTAMTRYSSKRFRFQIHKLNRMNKCEKEKMEQELELKNLKLYMENMSILKENEKLRKKATLLHQENLALSSQFHKKFPN